MKRRTSSTTNDPSQPSFFDLPQPAPAVGADFCAHARELLAESLAAAKDKLGLDRWEIATRMSRIIGRDITKNMLDRYCAPSADDWRFPLEALPALVQVTEDARLLTFITEACGFKAMPGEAAVLAELVTLELEERRLRERMAAARKRLPQDALDWAVKEAARRIKV